MKLLPVLTIAVVGAALSLPVAHADDEKPGRVVWEFSKSSDVSYQARLGRYLPVPWKTSVGAEAKMAGPDPRLSGLPVALWASIELPRESTETTKRATRLDARMEARTGVRRLILSDTLTTQRSFIDLSLERRLTMSFEPREGGRPHAGAMQKGRIAIAGSGTSVIFSTSANDTGRWHNSIALEQKLRKTITLSATVNELDRSERKARFRADWKYKW